jgi:hypothetical protein
MNIGFLNEFNIMEKIHNKRISELDMFWRKNMSLLFDNPNEDDYVKCRLVGGNCKTDFEVILNNTKRNLSVKYGESISLHTEHIDSFCEFLKIIGVSEETITTIRLYHFGDGTINGTGELRRNAKELQTILKNEIKKANKELNDEKVLKKIIYRSILKGRSPYHEEIDYLYYGNTKEGILISKEKLINCIISIPCHYLECIHFGPLVYQPSNRYLYSKTKEDYKRYYSQIKWQSINNDLNSFVNKT